MLVTIVPYDPGWPNLFEQESLFLQQLLGEVCIRVHHIGSTAVPGLPAKPIIDILLEVSSLEAFDEREPDFRAAGYEPRGELGIPGRRYFPKGGEQRTHHLHAFCQGDLHVLRHLAFRDYLRSHPETAREYGDLKAKVAAACNHDLGRYCDGKNEYVQKLEKLALKEQAAHFKRPS